ncbi:MAG: hypothetical protein BAJATHORv1_10542 [Candidatus Thorarchaeota archaeon]|nr:MAG: hypothetical protein BAJATHORv1_10542 [Candidatus Thorarchaeota archaeon]
MSYYLFNVQFCPKLLHQPASPQDFGRYVDWIQIDDEHIFYHCEMGIVKRNKKS